MTDKERLLTLREAMIELSDEIESSSKKTYERYEILRILSTKIGLLKEPDFLQILKDSVDLEET